MITFGIIGCLILAIIFIVTRGQSLEREHKQLKSAHKLEQAQNKHSLKTMLTIALQLQHAFQAKLLSLNSHGLISPQDFEVANFILENFQYVIDQCCQQEETVEVAIGKALKDRDLTMEKVSQFIARQPTEVKMPWSKNTVDGFITACRNFVSDNVSMDTSAE